MIIFDSQDRAMHHNHQLERAGLEAEILQLQTRIEAIGAHASTSATRADLDAFRDLLRVKQEALAVRMESIITNASHHAGHPPVTIGGYIDDPQAIARKLVYWSKVSYLEGAPAVDTYDLPAPFLFPSEIPGFRLKLERALRQLLREDFLFSIIQIDAPSSTIMGMQRITLTIVI